MDKLPPFEEQEFFVIYIGTEGHIVQDDGEYVGGHPACLADMYFDYKIEHGQYLTAKWKDAGLSVTFGTYDPEHSMFFKEIQEEYEELCKSVEADEKAWEDYNKLVDANTIEIQVEVYRCSQYTSYEDAVECGGNRMLDIHTTDRNSILSLLNCISESCDAFDGDWYNDLTYWVSGDIYMEDATPSEVFAAIDAYDPNNPALKVRPRLNFRAQWDSEKGLVNEVDGERYSLTDVMKMILAEEKYVPMSASQHARLNKRNDMIERNEFDFSKIPTETFQEISDQYLKKLSPDTILSIPGVFTAAQEYYNNEILDECKEDFEEDSFDARRFQEDIIEKILDWAEGDEPIYVRSGAEVTIASIDEYGDPEEGLQIMVDNQAVWNIIPGNYAPNSKENSLIPMSLETDEDTKYRFANISYGDFNIQLRKKQPLEIQAAQANIPFKQGDCFVLTGFRSPELQEKLLSLGFQVKTSVSGKTDFLIIHDGPYKKSSKVEKAMHLGIPIINKTKLAEMLGGDK